MTQNPHPEPSLIKSVLLIYLPLALGFGVYPLLIPALIVALLGIFWTGPRSFINTLQTAALEPGYLFFLAALALFFTCYRGFYLPYHPEILKMPWAYFQILFTLSIITVVWVSFFTSPTVHIGFLWNFCLGALLLGLGTIGAALVVQSPPYYSNVIDIRYLPFGLMKFINTPGMANLLCLFPVTFLAAIILEPSQRPRWFWTLGICGFALSLVAAVLLGQRSYFVTSLVIAPIIVSFFLLLLRAWRSFMAVCLPLICYPILKWLDQAAGTAFLYRPLDPNLFNDARFQMFQFWLNHLIADPFQRIDVGPDPWDSLQWFHNFFADIHRLSGFWALLAAAILLAFIFYRIICVIQLDRRFGLFLMAIAIPCFLIMNTSVVPEGERQPFLLLLAIGAIAEVTISRKKSRLNEGLVNPLANSQ